MFKGIVASVLASVLFGAIYYLSPFLAPLGGEEIFGWRVLCTLPFTTALLLWRGEGAQVRALWQRVRSHGEVLIRAERPSELRQLVGIRARPPYARPDAGRAWSVIGDRAPRRVGIDALGRR